LAEFPDHPFWDFSLDVYMSEGVGAACLALQEAHELDVNVLLYCSWLGASGRGVLNDAEMDAALGAVADWHEEVVRSLRAVRTRMKGGVANAPAELAESLRQRIQKAEIDCEHTEQLMLAAAVDRAADGSLAENRRAADAAANIGLYFARSGRVATDADRANLGVILGVAFRGIPEAEMAEIRDSIGR
jgi:uncharacterized protein (TIGR02444 family)